MVVIKDPTEPEEEDAEDAEVGGDETVVKEAEDTKVQGDDEPVHHCFLCDGCKMDPIVGVRYKCLEWVLFVCNLCMRITDGVVFSVAPRALITTCARPVQPKESTQLNTVC